jgi:Flp pilus assembly protein TadD
MSDPAGPHVEDRVDRYVRGELTAPEARDLAQQSLDDPELFENLTYAAVAKAGLAGSSPKVVRFPRKARVWAAVAAGAAAIVLVSLYSLKDRPPGVQNQPHESPSPSHLKPALAFSAQPGQPALLASALEPPPARREGAPVFRSPEPESRPPQQVGSIIAIEDGFATINLGALDGLAKGSELPVFRDERSTQPIGRLVVTTVFRERARGQIPAGQAIQVKDQVRVAASAYLGALLERVDVLSGRGETDAARRIAENAVRWTETANVPTGDRGKALERLAALEYQSGSLQAAETHYQSAVNIWNAASPASSREQSAALNALAVLHLLRGDYDGAEAPLRQALSQSAYAPSMNNLGALAELRGDRRKAEGFYRDALHAFESIPDSSGQERRIVEANLARVRSSP